MKRLMKREGQFNFVLEDAPIPSVGSQQVLVRNKVTLISRGSEIGGRYTNEGVVAHSSMGYSAAGVVEEVGAEVTGVSPGDRVMASAPHAEYVVVDAEPGVTIRHLPDELTFEDATFWPLTTSAVMWSWAAGIKPADTLVILGGGLIGNLCMQVMRLTGPQRIIVVEGIPVRCEIARKLGADEVINFNEEAPIEAIKRMTDGAGADVVIEAVGGPAGVLAFSQAQDMARRGGTIFLIGLYHKEPLQLDVHKAMNKKILGAAHLPYRRVEASKVALGLLLGGQVRPQEMITHRLDGKTEAVEAFRLLYERLDETMCVTLQWDED